MWQFKEKVEHLINELTPRLVVYSLTLRCKVIPLFAMQSCVKYVNTSSDFL